jgi:chromosome segregation ATPase
MMLHQELKEEMENHEKVKTQIEDEMFVEGDKLNALTLEKERKELEKQGLEMAAADTPDFDDGRILELEEEIYQVDAQIGNITDHLESLEETYEYHSKKLNTLNEQALSLAADSIEPLKFVGLQSIDAARVTLQTFFSVMLDVNIYKKDLEKKCIE